MTTVPDQFIDKVIPPEEIGTGPDDGLPHDFRAGCGSGVEPVLAGGLRSAITEFE